ncbi:unnamed protein product [Parnassius apollo]|uniref:(apollo) hypothetical protein n=1 Tax=Parnassius apollo TaxID=110799 RepID=A0A8S3XJZ1_PARAO|nr:unnamed protein product [Parnassius apollo]
MLSVIAMRRPEDEELGRGDGDEFVDISQMQLLVEAGPSGLQYGGPQPPLAQPAPYAQSHANTTSVDDFLAFYFTSAPHELTTVYNCNEENEDKDTLIPN